MFSELTASGGDQYTYSVLYIYFITKSWFHLSIAVTVDMVDMLVTRVEPAFKQQWSTSKNW